MYELSPLGFSPDDEAAWRDRLADGRAFAVSLDRAAVRRRLRANTAVRVVVLLVLAAAVAGGVAVMLLRVGGPLTVLLIALLALAAGILLVRFSLLHRRLRVGRASGDDFVVVSAEGIRLAGHIDLRWSAVIGGVGFDDRSAAVPLLRGPASAVERSAGRVQAEFVFGVRDVRALRDAAPRDLRGLFEVIGPHGGIRVPIDTMVAADSVRPAIAALCIAGLSAGADVEVTTDRSTIFARTVALLGPEEPAPPVAGGE